MRSVYDWKCLLRQSVRLSYKMFVLLIIDLWYEEGFLCIPLDENHIEIEMKHEHEKQRCKFDFLAGVDEN